jgi:hypothetical protein
MSDVQKLSLTVLHTVAEFLALLPADQLNALADGTARLAIIPKDATEPLHLAPAAKPAKRQPSRAAAEPTVDMSEIRDRLDRSTTREEADAMLRPLKQKPHLNALARLLGMRGYSSYTKGELIDAIIEFTVGNRLDSGAIRQL